MGLSIDVGRTFEWVATEEHPILLAHPVCPGKQSLQFIDGTKCDALRDGVYRVVQVGGIDLCMVYQDSTRLIGAEFVHFVGIQRVAQAGRNYGPDNLYDRRMFGFVTLETELLEKHISAHELWKHGIPPGRQKRTVYLVV